MALPRKEKFNAGRWRVQQERAQIDVDQKPLPPPLHVETLDSVMPGLMKRLGAAPDYWQERISTDWSQLVGIAIAKNTRPGKLEGVSLTVFVTNSVWLHELKQVGYKPLLEKLQKKYGAEKIRHLKLLPDPDVGRTMR